MRTIDGKSQLAVKQQKGQQKDGGKGSESDETPLAFASSATASATTLELQGVTIHFPFDPYPCQTDYMNKVITALHHGENALLESPTGTGKTLCLLCSALAWQRQQVTLAQPSDAPSDNSAGRTARPPTIVYASRTHSQLSQVVHELRNTRYRPSHAVLASREQLCVNEHVLSKQSSAMINNECSKLNKFRK